ncbi:MAG: hypothetical protein H6892_10100 [Brucellaceae bacterium]|nr:hypothetical protein [Brucellaceae bacterium]
MTHRLAALAASRNTLTSQSGAPGRCRDEPDDLRILAVAAQEASRRADRAAIWFNINLTRLGHGKTAYDLGAKRPEPTVIAYLESCARRHFIRLR